MRIDSSKGQHRVPAAERKVLIRRLELAGLPEPSALFAAGARHADYLRDWTDDELLEVDGIGPAAVREIRAKVGGPPAGA